MADETPDQNGDGTAAPESSSPAGKVIRTGENEYKLIDPRTGGAYILKAEKPLSDEVVIKRLNVFVRRYGRAAAGETLTVEPRNK